MQFVVDLWRFLRARKKLWLLPIIIVLAGIGGLLLVVQGTAIAPLIYTLF